MKYRISEIYKFHIEKGMYTTTAVTTEECNYIATNKLGEAIYYCPNHKSIRLEKI